MKIAIDLPHRKRARNYHGQLRIRLLPQFAEDDPKANGFSIGIEHIDDIVSDLERAFSKI